MKKLETNHNTIIRGLAKATEGGVRILMSLECGTQGDGIASLETAAVTAADEVICLHEAEEPSRFHGAVVPPIFGNSLFVYPSHEALTEALRSQHGHYLYWRGKNPTVEVAERKLALLERGEAAICFSSGMAAISAAVLGSVSNGGHALLVGNIYESTVHLLSYMTKFGVRYSIVPSMEVSAVEAAVQPETKVIYIESPSSLTFRLADIAAVAAMAKSRGIRTIVDNTWATPLYQKPLLLGADIVVHSASKYLGGHSDLVGGVLIANRSVVRQLFDAEYMLFGGAMAPQIASLLLRGLRTLPLRLRAHQSNAMRVATFLAGHPAVAQVHYPGLPAHPDHALARRQMSGFTGLMSFELREPTYDAVRTVLNRLQIVQRGVSWGSFESLAMSPNYGDNEAALAEEEIGPGLIRLSVGLEEPGLIIQDLKQALEGL